MGIANLLLPNICLLTSPTICKILHYISTACDIPIATNAFVEERCALKSTDNTVLPLGTYFTPFMWVQTCICEIVTAALHFAVYGAHFDLGHILSENRTDI